MLSGARGNEGALWNHVVLCGLGLGSKPRFGLGFYGLGRLKSQAQAGRQGSGWARAEPGLDPGLGRLTSGSLDVRNLSPFKRHRGHANQAGVVPEQLVHDHVPWHNSTHLVKVAQRAVEDVPREGVPHKLRAQEHVQKG